MEEAPYRTSEGELRVGGQIGRVSLSELVS